MQKISILFEIIPILGLTLYFIIGMLIAASFRNLRLEIEHYLATNAATNGVTTNINVVRPKFEFRFKKWRRAYFNLCDTVHLFQICFDSILLIWVVNIFITFINITFSLVSIVSRFGPDLEQVTLLVVFFIRTVLNLFVLTIVPVVIHKEVSISSFSHSLNIFGGRISRKFNY